MWRRRRLCAERSGRWRGREKLSVISENLPLSTQNGWETHPSRPHIHRCIRFLLSSSAPVLLSRTPLSLRRVTTLKPDHNRRLNMQSLLLFSNAMYVLEWVLMEFRTATKSMISSIIGREGICSAKEHWITRKGGFRGAEIHLI